MRVRVDNQFNIIDDDQGDRKYSPFTCIYFCKRCGTEIYYRGSSFNQNSNSVSSNDIGIFGTKNELCPLCNAEVVSAAGNHGRIKIYNPKRQTIASFRMWLTTDTGEIEEEIKLPYEVDEFFEKLSELRETIENNATTNVIDDRIDTYSIEEPEYRFTEDKINSIKSNPEELKAFVRSLITLEMDVYSLKERLIRLAHNKIDNERAIVRKECEIRKKSVDKIAKYKQIIHECESELTRVNNEKPCYPDKPISPSEPTMEKAGLFNKRKVNEENERRLEKYKQEKERYEQALQQYETDCAKISKDFNANKEIRLDSLRKDLSDAKQALTDAEENLEFEVKQSMTDASIEIALESSIEEETNKAYALLRQAIHVRTSYYNSNIIFEKYRNVVALSTFYEYLLSGRCAILEGANGAYNIYEAETRANLIISQLSAVITSLEEIKENQFLLYSELKKANKNLESLNGKMEKVSTSLSDINDNIELIEYNTAVTAYYSKKSAELTDALGLMVALK